MPLTLEGKGGTGLVPLVNTPELSGKASPKALGRVSVDFARVARSLVHRGSWIKDTSRSFLIRYSLTMSSSDVEQPCIARLLRVSIPQISVREPF